MRVFYSNSLTGRSGEVSVPDNTTLSDFVKGEYVAGLDNPHANLCVNAEIAEGNHVLKDKDMITVVPRKFDPAEC